MPFASHGRRAVHHFAHEMSIQRRLLLQGAKSDGRRGRRSSRRREGKRLVGQGVRQAEQVAPACARRTRWFFIVCWGQGGGVAITEPLATPMTPMNARSVETGEIASNRCLQPADGVCSPHRNACHIRCQIRSRLFMQRSNLGTPGRAILQSQHSVFFYICFVK